MCAKLRSATASNNRVHPTRSLSSSSLASTINCSLASQALLEVTHQDHSIGITLHVRYCYVQSFISLVSPEITHHDHSIIACSRHIYVVLFFARIPFVVKRGFSATPAKRLQQHPPTSFPATFTLLFIKHRRFVEYTLNNLYCHIKVWSLS